MPIDANKLAHAIAVRLSDWERNKVRSKYQLPVEPETTYAEYLGVLYPVAGGATDEFGNAFLDKIADFLRKDLVRRARDYRGESGGIQMFSKGEYYEFTPKGAQAHAAGELETLHQTPEESFDHVTAAIRSISVGLVAEFEVPLQAYKEGLVALRTPGNFLPMCATVMLGCANEGIISLVQGKYVQNFALPGGGGIAQKITRLTNWLNDGAHRLTIASNMANARLSQQRRDLDVCCQEFSGTMNLFGNIVRADRNDVAHVHGVIPPKGELEQLYMRCRQFFVQAARLAHYLNQ